MKILLSAYACEPNKGSEPGVGWGWATALSKEHDVWVITRDNNQESIEKYIDEHPSKSFEKINFVYVGLPKMLTFWKKGRRGMRIYYSLWQRKAARVAIELNEKIHFDFVQHVTFVSYTQVSYMYKIGIPFIYGPVSGGENIPDNINLKMTAKQKLIENVRKISQHASLLLPSIKNCMKNSKCILVATEETKDKIPNKYKEKTHIFTAIGIDDLQNIKEYEVKNTIKIVMVGRLIYWKAFNIGIQAFLKIVEKYPNVELHILGDGDMKAPLQKLAGNYLNRNIFFDQIVKHDEIFEYYKGYDLFLNTTLRDSGCMSMMEAMSVGLPCIAIATGGPAVLLREFPECCINPNTIESCVSDIAELLETLIKDGNKRREIGEKQYKYAKNIFWQDAKRKTFEEIVKQYLVGDN